MFIFALTLIPLVGLYSLTQRASLNLTSRSNKWSWYGSVLVFIPYILISGLVLSDPPRFFNLADQVVDLSLRAFMFPVLFILFFLLWLPVFGRERIKPEALPVFLLGFFTFWGFEQYARGFQSQDLLSLFIWPFLCLAFYLAATKLVQTVLEDRGRWYVYLLVFAVYITILSLLRNFWFMHLYLLFGLGFALIVIFLRFVFWRSVNLATLFKFLPELRIPMQWLGKVFPLIARFLVFAFQKIKMLVAKLIEKSKARGASKTKK